MMFHSLITDGKFDTVVKVMTKDGSGPPLAKYQEFCAVDNADPRFTVDSEITIDYQTIDAKTTYIDF